MDLPNIAISPAEWTIIEDILKRHIPQHEVWAFGSRARRDEKPYSDLDLAIIVEQPLGLALVTALAEDFSESDLPYKVDIVDWATTSARFRAMIEKDKVVVRKGAQSQQGRMNL